MENLNNNRFRVKLHKEDSYYRVHVAHPKFKSRIRKRIGDKTYEEADNVFLNIRFELGKQFQNQEITRQGVEDFIDTFISMNVKKDASIFEYKDEFLEYKKNSKNQHTDRLLVKSTLSGYRTALQYFEDYFKKKKIPQHPSRITDETLNGFYDYLSGAHNYKVKVHNKVKGFIKFLINVKNLNIDTRYKLSVYNEKYDNQCPEDNDIAIPEADVKKLIELRRKLQSGEIILKSKPFSDKLPLELQMLNREKLETNLVKSLDCFLFMISTGMYWADVMRSEMFFSLHGEVTHIKYRRSKNNSLCKAIPIQDDNFFIGGDIIKQYQIKNKSNFPLNLSLTHFDKHLHRISILAGLDYKITNKMARKTFASHNYFNNMMPIHYVQIMLGHKDVRDTTHYLRINDDDIAGEIVKYMNSNKGIKNMQ
jgi:site-specific recombinase XerD